MKNKVNFDLFIDAKDLTHVDVARWFRSLAFFAPKEMRCKGLINSKTRKYNEEKFFNQIIAEFENKDRGNATMSYDENILSFRKGSLGPSVVTLSGTLTDLLFEENKKALLEVIENFVIENHCMVAYMCSSVDDFWQNNVNLEYYDYSGRSKAGVKIRKSALFPDRDEVDVECNPGHHHIVNGIWFGSCWRMWFGKQYFQYIPRDLLTKFHNCFSNETIGEDVIKITLYESPWDYEKQENRERQWAFRRSLQMDQMADALSKQKKSTTKNDAAIEIEEGEFSHGGVRIIKYYYDAKRNLVAKSQAATVTTYELGLKGEKLHETNEEMNMFRLN